MIPHKNFISFEIFIESQIKKTDLHIHKPVSSFQDFFDKFPGYFKHQSTDKSHYDTDNKQQVPSRRKPYFEHTNRYNKHQKHNDYACGKRQNNKLKKF